MINSIPIKDFFEGKIKLWKSYWLVGELLNGLVLLIIFNLEIYFFNANSSVSQIPFLNFSNLTIISKLTIVKHPVVSLVTLTYIVCSPSSIFV